MERTQLLELVRCPVTGERLVEKGGELISSVSHADSARRYPIIDQDVACLYPRPQEAILEWGSRVKHFTQLERDHLKQLQQTANHQDSNSTRQRLHKQHEARHKNLAQIEKLLADWIPDKALPKNQNSQQIFSYFQLLFRDWCWGDELESYSDFVLDKVSVDSQKNVLILGSGAGGLSYRLANALPKSRLLSIEHNPFLALASARIMQGKSIKLYDYTLYPRTLELVAQKHEIKTAKLEHGNHAVVLGEFPALPIAEAEFDTVVAPWFLDILDQNFESALGDCLRFVKDDGQLLFIGPANVHSEYYEEQLCSTEILEMLQSKFEHVEHEQRRVPYLDSPLESQARMESVLFVCATGLKRGEHSQPKNGGSDSILRDSPELQQYRLKLATTQQILSVVEGDITAPELAEQLEKKFGFDESDSLHYARLFIAQISKEI
ncbi:MAG: methyltransferase domain-containing protein [Pseudomonadales bacterium]